VGVGDGLATTTNAESAAVLGGMGYLHWLYTVPWEGVTPKGAAGVEGGKWRLGDLFVLVVGDTVKGDVWIWEGE
jgi:hypothetical protein